MRRTATLVLPLLVLACGATSGAPDAAGPADAVADLPADTIADPGGPAGVTASEAGGVVTVAGGALTVTLDLATGRFRVRDGEGTLRLDGAEARVVWTDAGGEHAAGTSTAAGPARTWRADPLDDALGRGLTLAIDAPAAATGGPAVSLALDVREGAAFLTARAAVRWAAAPAGARVQRLSPIVADPSTAGALYVGADPAAHRMLDDGRDVYFDYDVQVFPVGDLESILVGPGASSNWNAALYDPATRRSVVAGFLTERRGVGLVAVGYDAAVAATDAGRKAFTRLDGISYYLGGRAPIAEAGGAGLESERFYLDLAPDTVFDGLEDFGRRLAALAGKTVRTEVPTGWNSWGGGGGAGGQGQDIDEAFLLANLADEVADFQPWGMRYFLVDDGWQREKGDWTPDPARFPPHGDQDGMAWIAAQAAAKGLVPGLWIAPFVVAKDGALAKAHPDWLAGLDPFGGVFVPKDVRVLDLSNPEVLAFVDETFARIRAWGYRWLKVDFSYYALFTAGLHDPDVTPSEAYRAAIDRIRQAAGPDTFLLSISATGLWFEVADGGRVTLDNMPRWGDPTGSADQGIKPTYRQMARRYYLNHTAWLNHPDLLFFRDNQGLAPNEARAWASAVLMSGGIVKLGESYEAMHAHPDWLAVVRPMLPVYPRSGRPLDLFDREYPEVWHLPIDDAGRAWDVVGLFHWGVNKDIGAVAWEPEAGRTLEVPVASLGLDPAHTWLVFDAWEHGVSWVTDGILRRTLPPRTAQVLVVRDEPIVPTVVTTSRHLLGGVIEVHDEAWDDATGRLTVRLDTVPGAPISVFVAPAGRPLQAAAPDGPGGPYVPVVEPGADGVDAITFVPQGPGATLEVRYGTSR